MTTVRSPSPDIGLLTGVLVAAAGYLLPWFRLGSREWFHSGWFLVFEDGGGWTLFPLVLLAAALVAAVWAGSNAGAAVASLGAVVGALILATLVIAAALVDGGVDGVADVELSVGVPLLAIGFGLAVTAGVASVASAAAEDAAEAIRRRYFPG